MQGALVSLAKVVSIGGPNPRQSPGAERVSLAAFGDDEVAALHPDELADMGVRRSRQCHALARRQFHPHDLHGMIGAAEHLFADITGLGIAPHRLIGGAREALALALGTQHEAREGEVEGAGEPDQHDGGGTDRRTLDLADGGLGDAGALGELSERPAAAVALEPQAPGQPMAKIVHYSIHSSTVVEISTGRQDRKLRAQKRLRAEPMRLSRG